MPKKIEFKFSTPILIKCWKAGILTKIINNRNPYFENFKKVTSFILIIFLSICEPSKGGIGIRLKTKSMAFSDTNWKNSNHTFSVKGSTRLTIPKVKAETKAIAKFEKGPAKVIRISSLLLVFEFGNETWTGFPQPIIEKPGLAKIINIGMSIVPQRSIWDLGSRVTLPCCLGSGSPNLSATHAWAHSWIVMQTINKIKRIIFCSSDTWLKIIGRELSLLILVYYKL